MITWLVLCMGFGVMTSFTVWSRIPTRSRGASVIALLVLVPLSGALLVQQRGWAAPIVPYLTNLPDGEIEVHGFRLIPETAIYLWLDVEGEPRAFMLPWNAGAASQLQRLGEKGEGVKAKKRKGSPKEEDESELEFHGAPQPSQPEKTPEAAFQYERQGE